MLIKIRKIRDSAKLPEYKTAHSAGADLFACLNEDVILAPGEIKVIPTGLVMEIEPGYEVQVRPRSGLSTQGISVPNAPGTIDADYRGEVGVILINLGKHDFVIKNGFRVAQMVAAKVEHAEFAEVSDLSQSARGAGGFGSTGI